MQVKFVDLGRQYQDLREEILDAVDEVFKSGWYVLGPKVEQFEYEFAEYCGVKHAVGVGNGSDALYLILDALNIGPGDEVITAPNSYIASAAAIARTGATPVFCDVGDDMNLDPAQLEAAITKRTKAVMPVHLTGRICKMERIQEIAGRYQIHVVEDAAQSVGASRKGKRAGCFGIAAGFSLHPLKNLFVHGDGGVVTTDSDALANRIRQSRNHGLKSRDEAEFWGINSRLDEVQAAIGSIKLRYIDQWNSRHREIAEYYSDALRGMVDVPVEGEDESSVYHRYMIRSPKRDDLAEHLAENGVETKVNYRVPLHLMPAAKESGYGPGSFPVCERLADTILSLPIYAALEASESEHVVEKVSLYINQ